MKNRLFAEQMGIVKTSRTVVSEVAMPLGGLARTRTIRKKVSLAALKLLGDPEISNPENLATAVKS